jgi:c(7)-type cytochrome triheme protein
MRRAARCHTGTIEMTFDFATKAADLPPSAFGNGVDWSKALASGKIHPVESLSPGFEPLTLDTTLSLEADWAFVPPATFPTPSIRWLDCANCHPEPFNVKKKTTKHFSMKLNLARQFCGACHVRVAFPLDDCKRCHPRCTPHRWADRTDRTDRTDR